MDKKPHKLKKTLVIVLVTVVVIAGGLLLMNRWVQQTVADKLRAALPGQQINFTAVHTQLLNGSIEIEGLSVRLEPVNKPSNTHHHTLYFQKVQLQGIQFLKWIQHKNLIIQNLRLQNGNVVLDEELLHDKNFSFSHITDRKQLAFKQLLIHSIKIDSINIVIENKHEKVANASGNFSADDLSFSSQPADPAVNTIPLESFSISLPEIKIHRGPYAFELANFNVTGRKDLSDISIDTVRIIPLYSREGFSHRLGYQADRIESSITGISVKELNTSSLIKEKILAASISIHSSRFYIYRDRRLPRRMKKQPLPVDMMKKLPMDVRVKRVSILNTSLTYEEFPKDGDHSGRLKVERLKVLISPFITHPVKDDTSPMVVRSEGSLMGSGIVYSTMYMPLHTDTYSVRGSFINLELPALNESAENLGRIHIESGLLDSLGFQFNFNKERSTGKIVGVYHHLVIQPLKGKSGTKKVAWFKSFMLRTFIIPLNKDRTLPERKRTGRIDYKRDPTRVVSYYLLQSLLTGIKSSFSLGFLLPK